MSHKFIPVKKLPERTFCVKDQSLKIKRQEELWKSFFSSSRAAHMKSPKKDLMNWFNKLTCGLWPDLKRPAKEEKEAIYDDLIKAAPKHLLKEQLGHDDDLNSIEESSESLNPEKSRYIDTNIGIVDELSGIDGQQEDLESYESSEDDRQRESDSPDANELASEGVVSEGENDELEEFENPGRSPLSGFSDSKVKHSPLVNLKLKGDRTAPSNGGGGKTIARRWKASGCFPDTVEKYKMVIAQVDPLQLPHSRALKRIYESTFISILENPKFDRKLESLLTQIVLEREEAESRKMELESLIQEHEAQIKILKQKLKCLN